MLKRLILLPMIIVAVVSSFTLWLVQDPIKYFFFTFQVILTTALVWLFVSPKISVSEFLRIKYTSGLSGSLRIDYMDYVFLFFSASLLVANILNIITNVNVLLAFVVISLLPGYVILRLTGVFDSVSFFGALILSYVLSLALSGILPVLFIPLANLNNRVAFQSLITFFSVLPILKDRLVKPRISQRKISFRFSSISLLTLSFVVGFFAITIMYLYPQMSLVPGLDIVRNLSTARLFSLSPAFFSSVSPSFLIYQSAMYSASFSSPVLYQTFLAFTSASLLLSFYVMAKEYLDEIDGHLPFFATIFWALFSGFGWMYLFENKFEQPSLTQMSLLAKAYDATYADVGYGISSNLWLWFIAMTASFTIFFVLLYLLKYKNIHKPSLILLFSILLLSLYFIHSSELFIFASLIIVLTFLGPRTGLRLDEALYSTLIALVGTIVLTYFLPIPSLEMPAFNRYLIIGLAGIVGLTCLFKLLKGQSVDFRKRSKFIKITAYAFLVFSIAGLLSWFPSASTFSISSVGSTFVVPWFFYPVRLGIVGLLGLLGIIVIADKHSEDAVVIFPFLFLVAWIIGRIVSFVNVNFLYIDYWEWRFLFFSFAAVSITSTLLLKFLQQKIIRKKSLGQVCLSAFLISLLVLVGISSTFLTIEKMALYTDQSYFDRKELDAVSYLSNLSNHQPSPLLTITPQSLNAMEFVPSPWTEKNIQPVIWTSRSSEIPLTFLNNLRFPPTIVYLNQRDLVALNSTDMRNGSLGQLLDQLMTPVYNNSEVKIYELPEGVPPLQNGNLAIVSDSGNTTDDDLLASYLLSFGGYNYTTLLISDPQIHGHSAFVFPSDMMNTTDLNELGFDNGQKIIILNTGGYGPLSRLFFRSGENNATVSARAIITNKTETTLPTTVTLSSLLPRDDNTTVLGWYMTDSTSVPLIAKRMTANQTELYYLNIYPIIRSSSFAIGDSSQSLFQILAGLLNILELPKYDRTVPSWVIEDSNPVFAFKESYLQGNITINANSIIPSENSLTKVNLTINSNQVLWKDVTELSIQNTGGNIAVVAHNVKIETGSGFYSFMNIDNPEIQATGDNILISAETSNGTRMNYKNSTLIELSIDGNFSTYLRDPRIQIIGKASFQEAYALHSYLSRLNTLGSGLNITGIVNLSLPISDEYSVASDFSWTGKVVQGSPTYTWDELGSIGKSIPYFILAVTIFSIVWVLAQFANKARTKWLNDSVNENERS